MRGAGSVFGQGTAIFSVPRSALCHGRGCPELVPGARAAAGSWAVCSGMRSIWLLQGFSFSFAAAFKKVVGLIIIIFF